MFYSIFLSLIVSLFTQSLFAHNPAEPNESGYVQLRDFLHKRYNVPLGKKCFPPVEIPSRNCHIEISQAPQCQHDWSWDQIYISIEAGERRQTLLALRAHTETIQLENEIAYYQYKRISEEGRYTGPLYLNDTLVFKNNKMTLSNSVSHPQWTKTVTCDLK